MEACRLSSEASYKTGKAVPTGHPFSGRQPAVRQGAADLNVHPIPDTISPGWGGAVLWQVTPHSGPHAPQEGIWGSAPGPRVSQPSPPAPLQPSNTPTLRCWACFPVFHPFLSAATSQLPEPSSCSLRPPSQLAVSLSPPSPGFIWGDLELCVAGSTPPGPWTSSDAGLPHPSSPNPFPWNPPPDSVASLPCLPDNPNHSQQSQVPSGEQGLGGLPHLSVSPTSEHTSCGPNTMSQQHRLSVTVKNVAEREISYISYLA